MSDIESYDTNTQEATDSPSGHLRPEKLPPRFEVRGELGRGGMGAVFWAFDKKLQRDVAVKLLTGDSEDDSLALRFRQEAKELSSFTHPNIVTLLDFGEFETQDFIVLEFLKGGNLSDWLKKKPPLAEIVDRFASISQGLDYIHNRGIVHRDLKPENILMTEDGQPRITDFGIARRLEKSTRFTQAGTILGTTTHMAPEQIMSSEVGPPADLYSLGVCLFEALTGTPPFTGSQHFALLQAHLTEKAPSVRSRRPEIPEELDRLVARMLKKKPEERPGSAKEVIAALRDLSLTTRGAVVPSSNGRAFVDRPEILQKLIHRVGASKASEGFSCHLIGPSGSGRSHLLKQFCQDAKAHGVRTVVISPTHEPTDALKRLWHLLGPSCPLQEILAYEGPTGCASWLRKRLEAAGQPTVLVADDLDRHYPTTLAVLRALAQLTPPPSSGWLLSSTPAQKIADGFLPTLDLPSWDREELDRLYETLRGNRPTPELSNWLEARSAGWPRQGKLLTCSLPETVGEPPSDLNVLVSQSLDRLSENGRLTLEVLSLSNQPASYDLLLSGTGLAHRSLDRSLAELVEGGFAEEDWTQTDCFRIGHDLYRELITGQLPDRTARRIHLALAHYYEKFEHSTLRGRHLLAAGEREQAYPVLLEEADRVKELGFFPMAHILLKAALSCCQPPAGDPAESRCRLAEVALESGSIEESKKILDATEPQTLSSQLQADMVRATMANLESTPIDESSLLTARGPAPTTIREMHLSIILHRQLAKAASRQEEFERAAVHLHAAFKLANTLGEPDTIGQVLIASGYLKLRQGEAAEAEVEARQAIEKTKHSENPRWKAKSFELLGEVQMSLGAPSRAALSFQQALEISRDALLDKRCLKLERKFIKAQRGEPLPPSDETLDRPAPSVQPTPPASASVPNKLRRGDETEIGAPAVYVAPPQPPDVEAPVLETLPEAPASAALVETPIEETLGASPVATVTEPAAPAEPTTPAEPPVFPEPTTPPESRPKAGKKAAVPILVGALVLCLVLLVGAAQAYQTWAKQPGRLILTSTPESVLVTYSGWPEPRTVKSGETLEFAPGAYDLKVSADGYAPADHRVSILRAEEVPWKVSLVSTNGTVKFTALPEKAVVFIDGNKKSDLKVGSTLTLPVGPHEIKTERRLFESKTQKIKVSPGQTTDLAVKLKPVLSDLVVSSTPNGATIKLDGKTQTTPTSALLKDLKPGKYTLNVSKSGFYDKQKEISLKAGEETKVTFKLEEIKKEPDPVPLPSTTGGSTGGWSGTSGGSGWTGTSGSSGGSWSSGSSSGGGTSGGNSGGGSPWEY